MFIDASALCAIPLEADKARELSPRLEASEIRLTSPIAVDETALAIARVRGGAVADAESRARVFLQRARISIGPLEDETASLALAAHAKYGKGRHPARLNMVDCFVYAMAKQHGVALLYQGGDLAKTDLA
jgi:ribonuclease VapC